MITNPKTSVFKNLLIQVINDIEKLMREGWEQENIAYGMKQQNIEDLTLSDYLASLNEPMLEFQNSINSYDGDTRMNYADRPLKSYMC